ncbi:MAG: bifunctional (p)ppGpp synthetase/guanosine-3',5'-bis(diphosphate) 3'-pyrophosphohydrolase [Deltaproteobacteria bacterium]|nr:bifunctional (p)ppGpp synthetase/guanosine-3',5'-bis(diphosphate) 3'-pyrophosphohydrolase [Deltaproteobacteria bacterium]
MTAFMPGINGLKTIAKGYLHDVDLEPIDKAWDLAVKVHTDKKHFSGEPYLDHVLEVASTLASMHLDLDTVIAGLLHGVLKEGVTVEQLGKEFGRGVAEIVEGCSRITRVHYNSQLAYQAENVRKMLLAIAADIRVLLVKLADRLQDMCSLESKDSDYRREMARETMDLYAPLASRLGIDWLKRELEDHSFRYLHPDEYLELAAKLESSFAERQKYVEEVINIIQKKLVENKIFPVRIIGRPKHIYSIYKKLLAQKIPFERVYDNVAFRIIVNTVDECYAALGVVHENWVPVPGRVKDFISAPKANNYQSMHTTVVGPQNNFIEVQIRTEKMDRIAQEGVAAHWAYKEGQKIGGNDAKLFRELKKLVNSLQEVEDPREFLENVRGELYTPEVYALTPGGEVKEFPLGSCPIDFAYAIHTEVGDRCMGAKVNDRLVPLKYEMQNGDIVEIITSKTQRPRRGWLSLVKTSRARSRIRSWLRREEKEQAVQLGRKICERELKRYETTLKKMVKSGHIKLLLKELRCNSLDDLLAKVGTGVVTVQSLVKALQPPELRDEKDRPSESTPQDLAALMVSQQKSGGQGGDSVISIDGIDDMLVKISQCCHPVPGDAVIGFITTGRGISVHKASCENLLTTDPRRWIAVSWSGTQTIQHRVEILVSAENRRGIVATISAAINADDANILGIPTRITPTGIVELQITLEVADLEHLQILLQHLRQLESVISAKRV